MASRKNRNELAEIAADLRQVIHNLELMQQQSLDGADFAGTADARERVDALAWEASNLLFWSNYSVRSDVSC